MPYIYQADLYCDSCGRDLQRTVPLPEGADPNDDWSYDSDDYPKGPFLEDEADSPHHCGSGGNCLEAIDLYAYYEGAGPIDPPSQVGAIVSDLTPEGRRYARECMDEPEPSRYQSALFNLWRDTFDL